MGTLANRDNQTLFWLLIIGILFYFYVDIRINKLRDEMRWHLMYMEQIYRNSLGSASTLSSLTKRRENFVPVDHWNTPRVVVNKSLPQEERKVKFVEDQVPTKEELNLVLNQVLGSSSMVSSTSDSEAPFAPEPWGSVDQFASV